MDQDSGLSASFFSSGFSSLVYSTPDPHLTRKRKRDGSPLVAGNFSGLESCPVSPQLSSTLKESHLINQFRDIQLGGYRSLPVTPQKQLLGGPHHHRDYSLTSPSQEARQIIYENGLKPRSSTKRLVAPSPRKIHRKSKAPKDTGALLRDILHTPLIMEKIFENLSDGCLFRISCVSRDFRMALQTDRRAYYRFLQFQQIYKGDKENYVMPTPPSSPEKCDSPPRSNSENFNLFYKSGKSLSRTQSQVQCPKCGKPCMVENNIGQCGNVNFCGYIYCLKCLSSSETGPENFTDKCGSAVLRNVSNCSPMLMEESLYSRSLTAPFTTSQQDSGFCSEMESFTSPAVSVKRQLDFAEGTPKPFASFNRESAPRKLKQKPKKMFAEVVVKKTATRRAESPPNSPPKKEDFVACSRNNKKRLKRLTF